MGVIVAAGTGIGVKVGNVAVGIAVGRGGGEGRQPERDKTLMAKAVR